MNSAPTIPVTRPAGATAPRGGDHTGNQRDLDRPWWRTRKGRIVLVAGCLLALAFSLEFFFPILRKWPFVAATLVAFIPIALEAFAAAREGRLFTIEMLMTIACVGALAIDAAEEAAVVVFLFAVGELLENVAASKARRSISSLGELTPKTAQLIDGDALREVDAERLVPGMLVMVRPGDRIPCDGKIIDGLSDVNESPVNGESVPRTKKPGDGVYAGTINLSAALRVEVTKASADNTISRIIRLVEEAQEAKAPVQRFIDRFSRVYMPSVVGIAVLIAVGPPLVMEHQWGVWIYRALALLLIACPCALVISTPAAIAAGLSVAARRGLLIKGGAVLEMIGSLKTIAFDKTGTLTEGKPKVTDVEGVTANRDAVVRLAAALELGSSHPIAVAILAYASEIGISPPASNNVNALGGRGIRGDVEGRSLLLGSPRAAAEVVALDQSTQMSIARLEKEGKTVAVLLSDKSILGFIAMRDEPRDDARAGIEALRKMGVRSIMLTGDNRRAADAVGRDLGLDVRAELMPEDKARIVSELRSSGGGPIGKVGDGINDAPALAAAEVGIAMGGGTDVAIEAADAALLKDRVMGVAELVALSRATLTNVRVNVAVALGSKAIFLVTTVLGITGMWIAVLADTGATVLVTLNALRLLRFRFH